MIPHYERFDNFSMSCLGACCILFFISYMGVYVQNIKCHLCLFHLSFVGVNIICSLVCFSVFNVLVDVSFVFHRFVFVACVTWKSIISYVWIICFMRVECQVSCVLYVVIVSFISLMFIVFDVQFICLVFYVLVLIISFVCQLCVFVLCIQFLMY